MKQKTLECCGNPLRGCENCPPIKLTFEEWYVNHSGWNAWSNGRRDCAFPFAAIQAAWQAAQENK